MNDDDDDDDYNYGRRNVELESRNFFEDFEKKESPILGDFEG